MNIYKELNECIQYIEDNLDKKIDYKYIGKIFGCSEATIQRVFSIITGMTLTEYIRKRRLTLAIKDLKNKERIIDIAFKYGYTSDTSFSRSFKKMHGVLPSKVKNGNIKLHMQPILKFKEEGMTTSISYRIEEVNKFTLYGIKREVDICDVPSTAVKFWTEVKNKYPEFKENITYGVLMNIGTMYYYFCAIDKKLDGLEKIIVPKSKYMIFKNNNRDGYKIKKIFQQAYDLYVPSVGFSSNGTFELEKYYKDSMEIYVKLN